MDTVTYGDPVGFCKVEDAIEKSGKKEYRD